MKILFYVPSSSYGGGESYIYNLIQQTIEDYNFEILLITACELLSNKLRNYKEVKIKLIKPAHKLGLGMFLGIRTVNRYKKYFGPDIIFLNGLPESGVLARFVSGGSAKNVCVCHSNEFWLRELSKLRFKNAIKRLLTNGFANYLDKIIVITDEALNSFEYIEKGHCTIKKIHNGIPKIHKNNFLKQKRYTFGRISRLCQGKGNEMLLRCLKRLLEDGLNVNLLLAGDGAQKKELELLVETLQIKHCVDFAGHIEPAQFFSGIDCMVSPSDMEALPTVISEAMSCNIPVIATSVGGVPEMVSHNETGYLIPPKLEDELLNAMKQFINKPEIFKIFSSNAYIEYEKLFSIEISSKNTWEFINE